jgi:hypothetical protein
VVSVMGSVGRVSDVVTVDSPDSLVDSDMESELLSTVPVRSLDSVKVGVLVCAPTASTGSAARAVMTIATSMSERAATDAARCPRIAAEVIKVG